MSQEKSRATFVPLDLFRGKEDLLSAQARRRWLLALMVAGLVLRLTRYLLRFPLWEDEAGLAANLLDRDYGGLLQPLHYLQVAPTLFLWGQLTLVKLLGFHEYALRLMPFLCGLASLLLFRHVAGRLLQGTALVLAVGLFAVSSRLACYSAEAKPYGCDVLVSLALLALTVEWLRRPDRTRWLWCLAALVGPAVGYSFPAVFVAGGVSLVVTWVITTSARRVPSPRGRVPWIVYNVVLVASFAAVLVVSKGATGAANQHMMDTDWAYTFPPILQPLKLPWWLLETHAGAMLSYPDGGSDGGSTLSLLCVIVGVAVLVRRHQWLLLGLLLAPLGLNFIAAALHRYPYGGQFRLALFLAPVFCVLIALGLTAALVWIEDWRRRTHAIGAMRSRARTATLRRIGFSPPRNWNICTMVLALLVLLGARTWLLDLAYPYKSARALRAREFAQWFWFEMAHDSELVSCETDLKTDLSPDKLNCGWSSLYFCNLRIYSPRHAWGGKPQWERVSVDRPLRCLLYRSPQEEQESPPPDPQARQRWLEKMQADYDLAAHDTYPFAAYDKSDRRQPSDDYVEVFKFLPKAKLAKTMEVVSAAGLQE